MLQQQILNRIPKLVDHTLLKADYEQSKKNWNFSKLKQVHREKMKKKNWITLKTVDNLKKYDTIDIWIDPGDFQLGTGSMLFHFLSSMNEISASLSRLPLYWRNSPLSTLNEKKTSSIIALQSSFKKFTKYIILEYSRQSRDHESATESRRSSNVHLANLNA